MPLDPKTCEGKWLAVVAVDPASVCCDSALFVTACRSVGVELHPAMPFRITIEKVNGRNVTKWTWVLADRSKTNGYTVAQLEKWWRDPVWLKANPTHEFAILRAGLVNHAVLASEVRSAVPRVVLRRGRMSVHIPMNAAPERREWLLAKFEGRLPLTAPFVQPAG